MFRTCTGHVPTSVCSEPSHFYHGWIGGFTSSLFYLIAFRFLLPCWSLASPAGNFRFAAPPPGGFQGSCRWSVTSMDLDMVDYLEEEIVEDSIWTSHSAKLGIGSFGEALHETFFGFLAFYGPSNHQLILLDDPLAWPSLSFPLPSLATLGFASGCLNPNPSSPALGQFTLLGFSVNLPSPGAPLVSSSSLSPPCTSPHPLGRFTGILPLMENITLASSLPPLNPTSKDHPWEGHGSLAAENS